MRKAFPVAKIFKHQCLSWQNSRGSLGFLNISETAEWLNIKGTILSISEMLFWTCLTKQKPYQLNCTLLHFKFSFLLYTNILSTPPDEWIVFGRHFKCRGYFVDNILEVVAKWQFKHDPKAAKNGIAMVLVILILKSLIKTQALGSTSQTRAWKKLYS